MMEAIAVQHGRRQPPQRKRRTGAQLAHDIRLLVVCWLEETTAAQLLGALDAELKEVSTLDAIYQPYGS